MQMCSVLALAPHYMHTVLNIAHTEKGEGRIGAADRSGVITVKRAQETKREE